MEIKTLSKSEDKLRFLIKGIDSTVANTLRRVLITEIPILAIQTVTFVKNSSALFDEVVAHRLGLIPLNADIKDFDDSKECSCKGKGCGKCTVTFTLTAEGPLTVYAEDLKCSDDKVKTIHGKMPIVKLLKGQELEFEAVATLGKGLDHAKYTPCLPHYQGYPKITFDKVKNAEEVIKECPDEVFELSGKTLKVKNLENCTLCGACEAASEGTVKCTGSEEDFIFSIESWGQMSPKALFDRALEVLESKVDDFGAALSKAK